MGIFIIFRQNGFRLQSTVVSIFELKGKIPSIYEARYVGTGK